ncbi:hypothetical protein N2152v2_005708 [Parachlorella kessleri]
MAHGNVRLFLCLVLLCGAATARSLVETHPVTAEASEDLFVGDGHQRQLKQSGTQLSGAFEVQTNPGLPCNDFNRDAGTPPNQQYRQGVQYMVAFAANLCGFYDTAQPVTKLSTKCRVDPQTKLARSVFIEYTTISFVDSTQRACINNYIQQFISGGNYGYDYVNEPLQLYVLQYPNSGYGKWVITAPLADANP